MKDIIKMEKISTPYIFHNFNLNIKENSFVTIVGTNNSGKTTLVKILSGLSKYEGYINVDSYLLNDFHLSKIRNKISFVFDDINANFVSETVKDDLVFSLENLQLNKEEITKKLEKIVKIFNLENYLELSPYNLSNSMKQKLAIANALIHEPKILVLDDCINQLNIKDRKEIFKILKKYQKEGLTIIMTTRNLEDSLYCDRIVVLDKGEIILDNEPLKIYKEDKKLNKLKIKKPFIIELSQNLMLYNLIEEEYTDFGKLVDAIWR